MGPGVITHQRYILSSLVVSLRLGRLLRSLSKILSLCIMSFSPYVNSGLERKRVLCACVSQQFFFSRFGLYNNVAKVNKITLSRVRDKLYKYRPCMQPDTKLPLPSNAHMKKNIKSFIITLTESI